MHAVFVTVTASHETHHSFAPPIGLRSDGSLTKLKKSAAKTPPSNSATCERVAGGG